MFDVENGIEVPAKMTGNPLKYPWDKMDIGDSFHVEHGADHPTNTQRRLSAAADGYGYRHNMKFITRQVEGGVRVWRIE